MGVGVGVGSVCGPKVAPLASLPVWEVEQPPPLLVCAGGGGFGVPPPCSKLCQGHPKSGGCCA